MLIANANGVFGNVVADVVGRAVGQARSDSAAGQPHREGVGMMIAADETLFERVADIVLHHRRAAEFVALDDERVVEHAALLEIGDQARFGQPPRQQAIVGQRRIVPLVKRARVGLICGGRDETWLGAVQIEKMLRRLRNIHHGRHGGLHAKGQLILRNPREDLGVSRRLVFQRVEPWRLVEELSHLVYNCGVIRPAVLFTIRLPP